MLLNLYLYLSHSFSFVIFSSASITILKTSRTDPLSSDQPRRNNGRRVPLIPSVSFRAAVRPFGRPVGLHTEHVSFLPIRPITRAQCPGSRDGHASKLTPRTPTTEEREMSKSSEATPPRGEAWGRQIVSNEGHDACLCAAILLQFGQLHSASMFL